MAQIVRRDRWMPWHYRGLPLCYAIVSYGGDPFIRLFDSRKGRDWFMRNGKGITHLLGIGVVNFFPDHRPEPTRATRVAR